MEPENRLVARALERKWEVALSAGSQLKLQYEQFLREQPAVLTGEERTAIQDLAQDIPVLWSADTTSAIDRQMIVRLLIERILTTVVGNTEAVQVDVHWRGGHSTRIVLDRPAARLAQMSHYHALMGRVKDADSGC